MRDREGQREKQAPCRKPDVGLDPGTPGSRPGSCLLYTSDAADDVSWV